MQHTRVTLTKQVGLQDAPERRLTRKLYKGLRQNIDHCYVPINNGTEFDKFEVVSSLITNSNLYFLFCNL